MAETLFNYLCQITLLSGWRISRSFVVNQTKPLVRSKRALNPDAHEKGSSPPDTLVLHRSALQILTSRNRRRPRKGSPPGGAVCSLCTSSSLPPRLNRKKHTPAFFFLDSKGLNKSKKVSDTQLATPQKLWRNSRACFNTSVFEKYTTSDVCVQRYQGKTWVWKKKEKKKG